MIGKITEDTKNLILRTCLVVAAAALGYAICDVQHAEVPENKTQAVVRITFVVDENGPVPGKAVVSYGQREVVVDTDEWDWVFESQLRTVLVHAYTNFQIVQTQILPPSQLPARVRWAVKDAILDVAGERVDILMESAEYSDLRTVDNLKLNGPNRPSTLARTLPPLPDPY